MKPQNGSDPVSNVISRLNSLGLYPKHGWVKAAGPAGDTAYLIMPFLTCMEARRQKLLNQTSGPLSGEEPFSRFGAALEAFRNRFVLYLKSLELLANVGTADPLSREGFAILSLYSDLTLYEFGCAVDTLAKLLAFLVHDRPDQVRTRSFGEFRRWCLTHCPDSDVGRPLSSCTHWYDVWWRPAPGKGPRDQRTHHQWEYSGFSRVSRSEVCLISLRLSGRDGHGKAGGCNVFHLLRGVTEGLMTFLSEVTPREDGHDYVECDALQPEELRLSHWLGSFASELGA